jgi:hypothetical protein
MFAPIIIWGHGKESISVSSAIMADLEEWSSLSIRNPQGGSFSLGNLRQKADRPHKALGDLLHASDSSRGALRDLLREARTSLRSARRLTPSAR